MNIKSILPLVILLALGILAYYYTQDKSKNKASADEDWIMHVEDKEDIHRIFIADRKGKTIDLTRDGKRWMLNGKYRANQFVMYSVLEALTRVRMKNRPASAAIPNMINALSTKSTKVEVYDKRKNLLKVFYIGGVTPDERGTYMILEGSNNPYVMHIPMADVSLQTRFFTNELKWRDKTIFELAPKDIVSVSLEYPKRKNKSFKLYRNKGKWNVDPFFPTTKKIDKDINQDLVQSYLTEFKKLGAESFEKRTKRVEKTLMRREFCIVTIILTDGTTQQVNFFPIQEFDDDTSDKPNPVEKYVTVTEQKDILITQHLVFKGIFWGYDFFF